jgi:hypothetical protein
MKNLLLLLVAVAVCGCGPMRGKSVDPVRAAAVAALVESGNYKVYFETMEPMRGRPWDLLPDMWNIELREGAVYSYLPYLGEAYMAMPGPQDGLTFDSKAYDYAVKPGRNGALEVSFWAKSNDDRYDYRMTVYPSGSVYLRVVPDMKTSVGFDGKLKM